MATEKRGLHKLVRQVAEALPDAQIELGATDEHRIGLKPILKRVWTLPVQPPFAPVEPLGYHLPLVASAHPQTTPGN